MILRPPQSRHTNREGCKRGANREGGTVEVKREEPPPVEEKPLQAIARASTRGTPRARTGVHRHRNRLGHVSPILARLACQTARCRRLHEDARLQPGFRVNTKPHEQRPADS
jgi:hypothetical protein